MSGFWVGGYTEDGGGIRLLAVDGATVQDRGVAVGAPDASYLLRSPDRPDLVYAVDEGGNGVVALRADGQGGLTELVRVPVAGDGPCHLAVVAGGTLLLAACYRDGAVSAHRLDADGLPAAGEALPAPEPAPTGPHPTQDGPHAHAALELPDGTLLIADLGTDRVLLYARDGDSYRPDGAIALPPACGPRDLLVLPGGAVLLLGEHDSTLHVLDVTTRTVRASVPATVDPAAGDQAAGLTLTGDLLTVGLRGSERIAVLRLGDDGVPVAIGWAPSGGARPRHHLVVDGAVLIANEQSGTVTTLPLGADGRLGEPGPPLTLPMSPNFLLAV